MTNRQRPSVVSPSRRAGSSSFRISGSIIRYGQQAPRGGPARASWCLAHGFEELATARREFGIALRLLIGILPGGLRRLPEPYGLHRQHPEGLDRTIGRRRVERWFGLRRAFDARQAQLEDRWRAYLDGGLMESAHHARAALQAICNAYNYFDDLSHDYPDCLVESKPGETRALKELLDNCHELVHRYGELVGGLFGCHMEYKDDTWYDGCLVSLLHLRFGNSSGFTARYVCSICGLAAGDCDHRPGETYPKIAGVTHNGFCDICNDSCAHEVGATYEVEAGIRLADIQLQEVSMVPRPRDPLTRITHRTVDPKMFVERLGRIPKPGEPVLCHTCMYPCEGFRHLGG